VPNFPARYGYQVVNTSGHPVRIERRAIPAREPIVLRLPFPPAVEALFVHVDGRGRVATQAYAAWRAMAADAILRAKARRMSGAVEILMIFRDRIGRGHLDNLPRACLEILVAKGVIEAADSRIVRRLTLQWAEAPGATIEIRSLDANANGASRGGRA
jgi:hypothetical protein